MNVFKNLTAALLVSAVVAPGVMASGAGAGAGGLDIDAGAPLGGGAMPTVADDGAGTPPLGGAGAHSVADDAGDALLGGAGAGAGAGGGAPIDIAGLDLGVKKDRKTVRSSFRGAEAAKSVDFRNENVLKSFGLIKKLDGYNVNITGETLKTYLSSKRSAATKGKSGSKEIAELLNSVYFSIIGNFGSVESAVKALNTKPLTVEGGILGASLKGVAANAGALKDAAKAFKPYDPRINLWLSAAEPLKSKGLFTNDGGTTKLSAEQLRDLGVSDISGYERIGKRGGSEFVKGFDLPSDIQARRALKSTTISDAYLASKQLTKLRAEKAKLEAEKAVLESSPKYVSAADFSEFVRTRATEAAAVPEVQELVLQRISDALDGVSGLDDILSEIEGKVQLANDFATQVTLLKAELASTKAALAAAKSGTPAPSRGTHSAPSAIYSDVPVSGSGGGAGSGSSAGAGAASGSSTSAGPTAGSHQVPSFAVPGAGEDGPQGHSPSASSVEEDKPAAVFDY